MIKYRLLIYKDGKFVKKTCEYGPNLINVVKESWKRSGYDVHVELIKETIKKEIKKQNFDYSFPDRLVRLIIFFIIVLIAFLCGL